MLKSFIFIIISKSTPQRLAFSVLKSYGPATDNWQDAVSVSCEVALVAADVATHSGPSLSGYGSGDGDSVESGSSELSLWESVIFFFLTSIRQQNLVNNSPKIVGWIGSTSSIQRIHLAGRNTITSWFSCKKLRMVVPLSLFQGGSATLLDLYSAKLSTWVVCNLSMKALRGVSLHGRGHLRGATAPLAVADPGFLKGGARETRRKIWPRPHFIY